MQTLPFIWAHIVGLGGWALRPRPRGGQGQRCMWSLLVLAHGSCCPMFRPLFEVVQPMSDALRSHGASVMPSSMLSAGGEAWRECLPCPQRQPNLQPSACSRTETAETTYCSESVQQLWQLRPSVLLWLPTHNRWVAVADHWGLVSSLPLCQLCFQCLASCNQLCGRNIGTRGGCK